MLFIITLDSPGLGRHFHIPDVIAGIEQYTSHQQHACHAQRARSLELFKRPEEKPSLASQGSVHYKILMQDKYSSPKMGVLSESTTWFITAIHQRHPIIIPFFQQKETDDSISSLSRQFDSLVLGWGFSPLHIHTYVIHRGSKMLESRCIKYASRCAVT